MTLFQALEAFSTSQASCNLWRAPTLRLSRYLQYSGGSTPAADALRLFTAPSLPGGAEATAGTVLTPSLTDISNHAAASGSLSGLQPYAEGKSKRLKAQAIRQSVDAQERRLAQTVTLLRQQGRSPDDYAGVFTELERRLLTEIGAG